MLKVEGVTHWSIPVNDLEESETFYRDILGLDYKGRLGNSGMCCFVAGGSSILLCQRNEAVVRTPEQDNRLHHSLTVTPTVFEEGCRLFHERGIPIVDLVYREQGFFTGRELYFLDPSGNLLELRDPTWKPGMPTPRHEELARA
jgi:catechol 2,3-dioxygenase-like lactoylglutathione lyase family enzyme